jgi:uncharacterized protein YodC (DUF2158 family)
MKGTEIVSEFKAGDVVQLKSGGPKMNKLVTWQGVVSAACDWFVGSAQEQQSGTFPLTSLKVAQESGPAVAVSQSGRGTAWS